MSLNVYETLTGAMRFGRQEWTVSETQFTIQRVVSPREQRVCTGIIIGAVACMVLSGATGLLELTAAPAVLGIGAIIGALGYRSSSWEVTLDKERRFVRRNSHNKSSTQQWSRDQKAAFPYTAVVLRTRGRQGWRTLLAMHSFTVKLEVGKGSRHNIDLGGGESREEAMALAESLSRFLNIDVHTK